MSWLDHGTLPRLAVALASTLALAGCFRPLYGPTASGAPLREVLAAIEIDKPVTPVGQERLGYFVKSELAFGLDGSGEPAQKRYTLRIDAAESVQPISVDTRTGRADAATLNGTVRYTLLARGTETIVTAGTARATATYNRDQQRFASVRAARDAEQRLANLIAEDIKMRLAAYLATAP